MNYRRTLGAACLPLLSAGLVAGCQTYSVMQHGPQNARSFTPVPGIPFYVRRAACRQETVYREDLLRVRLVVERQTLGADGNITKRDTTFDQEKLTTQGVVNRGILQGLKDAIRSHPTSDAPVTAAFRTLEVYDPTSNWDSAGKTVMISNQMTPNTYVDYSTTYYMNSQRPVVGSATNTFKLNPDGTLAEGSATIDDQSVATIGGFLPIAEILSGLGAASAPAAPGAAAAAGGRRAPRTRFQYVLTVEAAPILHSLARTRPLNDAQTCAPQPKLTRADSQTAEYVRKPATAPTQTPEPPKGNNITISGQLTLPPKQ